MEENQKTKKGHATLILLIIALLIIAGMAYVIYYLYNENKNDEDTIESLNASMSALKETESNVSGEEMTFDELMNLIYPIDNIEKDDATYYLYNDAEDSSIMVTQNADETFESAVYWKIYVEDNNIGVRYINTQNLVDESYTIQGIGEEIVDVEAESEDGHEYPSTIYFLTRNGNVYYVTNLSEDLSELDGAVLTKVDGLSQVVAIKTCEYDTSDSMHTSPATVASLYTRDYEVVGSYIAEATENEITDDDTNTEENTVDTELNENETTEDTNTYYVW